MQTVSTPVLFFVGMVTYAVPQVFLHSKATVQSWHAFTAARSAAVPLGGICHSVSLQTLGPLSVRRVTPLSQRVRTMASFGRSFSFVAGLGSHAMSCDVCSRGRQRDPRVPNGNAQSPAPAAISGG